ncbi:hypothetical protein [Rhizobium sp. 9140]|uniref:hypothetical protein n=1 Tax=Rhizobium sp. 9140 TaxID=1761900 RepID=UPI000AD315B8
MNTPVSILPETGKPWRSRFDARTLATEERMLQSAAYILCAYLTGMRDCEVQAMRRGCLSVARSKDGMIMRHCVRSVAYKGKSAGASLPSGLPSNLSPELSRFLNACLFRPPPPAASRRSGPF